MSNTLPQISNTIFNKITFLIKLIKEGKINFIWLAFIRRIYSEEIAFGFKRDLSKEIKKPRALIKITTRIAQDNDDDFFKDRLNNGLIKEFQTCYVATTKEGIPCFRVWLIDSSQNEKLKNIWENRFPVLKKDEVLLENVLTVPKFRGMGIMPVVVNQIAEKGKELGAKYAIAFGSINNLNTSRSFNYIGFNPYIVRRVKWFLFAKSISFEEISDNLMDYYNKTTFRKPSLKKQTN